MAVTPSDAPQFLLLSIYICLMQAGFAMLETGHARITNVQNVLMKNFIDLGACAVSYWAIGYAFSFGGGSRSNSFVGASKFFLVDADDSDYILWFYDFVFLLNSSAIFGGSIAGRSKFIACVALNAFHAGITYPVVSHWYWATDGWLTTVSNSGVIDLSGSGVVHITGGMVGLAGALLLGPRFERVKDGKFVTIHGHHKPMAFLGAIILWAGWLAFNCSSVYKLHADRRPAVMGRVLTTTMLCASFAGITVFFIKRYREEHYDLSVQANAFISGLVAITGPCAVVDAWAAAIIGVVAAILYLLSSALLVRYKIDDALDAFPVHAVCGFWGLLSAGIFAKQRFVEDVVGHPTNNYGFVYGSDGTMLGVQALAGVVTAAWAFVLGFGAMYALKWKGMLKVSKETELGGIDLFKHNVSAYPDFLQANVLSSMGDNGDRIVDGLTGNHSVFVSPQFSEGSISSQSRQPAGAPQQHYPFEATARYDGSGYPPYIPYAAQHDYEAGMGYTAGGFDASGVRHRHGDVYPNGASVTTLDDSSMLGSSALLNRSDAERAAFAAAVDSTYNTTEDEDEFEEDTSGTDFRFEFVPQSSAHPVAPSENSSSVFSEQQVLPSVTLTHSPIQEAKSSTSPGSERSSPR